MSHHRRFFCPTDLGCPPWLLGEDEARHALKVLRLRAGDEIVLMDGRGGTTAAILTELSGGRAVAEPSGIVKRHVEPSWKPWLLVGAPDPPALDEIVEHAVELGVWRILVARAERSPATLASLERRLARWRGLIVSAGKQSGNPWFPEVHIFPSVEEASGALPPSGFLLAQRAERLSPEGILPPSRAGAEHLALAVGPEGDFTVEEMETLLRGGLRCASLGAHVLRVGTACLAALAVVQAAFPGEPLKSERG